MEQRNARQFVRESWADLGVPLAVGAAGFSVGWALWQSTNAPCLITVFGYSPFCLNQWEENVLETAAINPGIAGWGIGTAVGAWLRDLMLSTTVAYQERVEFQATKGC